MLAQVHSARQYVSPRQPVIAVAGGLTVGGGASAIFVVLLTAIGVHERFQAFRPADWTLFATVVFLSFVAAAGFAVLVAAARGERIVWWRTLIVGASLRRPKRRPPK